MHFLFPYIFNLVDLFVGFAVYIYIYIYIYIYKHTHTYAHTRAHTHIHTYTHTHTHIYIYIYIGMYERVRGSGDLSYHIHFKKLNQDFWRTQLEVINSLFILSC